MALTPPAQAAKPKAAAVPKTGKRKAASPPREEDEEEAEGEAEAGEEETEEAAAEPLSLNDASSLLLTLTSRSPLSSYPAAG